MNGSLAGSRKSTDALTIYFHGLPGGPAELALFDHEPTDIHKLYAPDRGEDLPNLDFPAYLDALETRINDNWADVPIHIIGFSLGARVALEMAARLGKRVAHVDLVSAAAPLSCGVDLSEMAGGAVFRAARDAPAQFRWLTRAQAMVARTAPALLMKMIFASAKGDDRELAKGAHFRTVMQGILRKSLGAGAAGYRRELLAYVTPWDDVARTVEAPVTLWHGEIDNWAPPMMAHWLAKQLPNVCDVHFLKDKSHYSTLAYHRLHRIGKDMQWRIRT